MTTASDNILKTFWDITFKPFLRKSNGGGSTPSKKTNILTPQTSDDPYKDFRDKRHLTEDEIKKWGRREKFSKYLPWIAYDPKKKIYLNDDDTEAFILIGSTLLAGNEQIEEKITAITNHIPDGGILTVHLLAIDYIDKYLEHHKALKRNETTKNPLLEKQVERFTEFLKKGTKGMPHLKGTPIRDIFTIFSLKIPRKSQIELEGLRTAFKETLKAIGIATEVLEPELLIKLMYYIFNGTWEENLYWEKHREIRDHIITAETPIKVRYDHLQLGNRYFGCITPKQIPPYPNLNSTAFLTGGLEGVADDTHQIPGPFLFSVIIVKDTKIPANIMAKAGLFKNQMKGDAADSIFGRLIGEYAAEHIEAANAMEKGDKFFYAMPTLWVWADSKHKLHKCVEQAKMLFQAQGYVPQKDHAILSPLLISSLPCGFYNVGGLMQRLDRYFMVNSHWLAKILPLIGDFKNGGQPHILMAGRKGQIISWDIFDKKARNRNIMVIGTTGGGKSFFLNSLVNASYASGALIRLFDLGYSYEKQCKILKGYYLDPAQPGICINPFTFAPDPNDQQEFAKYISNIANMVCIAAYAETDKMPSQEEINLARMAVKYAWQQLGPEADMNIIYEFLAKFPLYAKDDIEVLCTEDDSNKCVTNLKEVAQRMAFNLTHWIDLPKRRGEFASLFNGKANVDLINHRFIVTEFENINKIPALRKVLTVAILNATTQSLYLLPRHIPKLLLFEECGTMLQGNELLTRITEEAYRRIRKNYGSAVSVFQGPHDFNQLGATGKVILANSEFHVLFPNDTYTAAIKDGILPYQGYEAVLESISSNLPYYTELGLKTPYGFGIVRPIVDSFSYYINTSEPREWSQIKDLTEKYDGDLVKAIEELANERDKKFEKELEYYFRN